MKKHSAPANWEALYNVVKAVRAQLDAPVDQIGCNKLFDAEAPQEDQRYQTLLALMLSAQTRDQKTAEAMQRLKAFGCTARSLSKCTEKKLSELISPVCFHNNKAKHIKKTTDIILQQHGGVVPREYEALVAMPGLGPKMVHLFLQSADGKVEGIGVDVHVHRIARRWKWVSAGAKLPDDTRKELEAWLPRKYWGEINEILVGFGQTVCTPRFPNCINCPARALCPNAFKEESSRQRAARLATGLGTVKRAREEGAAVAESLSSGSGASRKRAFEQLCAGLASRKAASYPITSRMKPTPSDSRALKVKRT